ncbi:MAG TPA: DUF4238 domain-containing protein [Solirubrobacteraceae bacterium]|nr:DUF4238 domain-containing protein [Solirubrobacteraceae bacterium]
MPSNTPRKHHTVTAGYLRRFALNKRIDIHRGSATTRKGARGVAFQLDYWGSPDVAAKMEAWLGKEEDRALDVLSDLGSLWPLRGDDRGALGIFMAIHVVRTPAYGGLIRQMGARADEEILTENATELGLSPEEVEVYAELLRGDDIHAHTLTRQARYIGSYLASMHWSLVEFEEPLITSDQPVVLLPPIPVPITPASAQFPTGLAATFEGRFTLDPHHALVMSWDENPTEPTVQGTYAQARSINVALKAQAVSEWYSQPGTAPPFLVPPHLQERVYAISQELRPGYSVERARSSARRQHAEGIVDKMIMGENPGQMPWAVMAVDET